MLFLTLSLLSSYGGKHRAIAVAVKLIDVVVAEGEQFAVRIDLC